MKKLTNRLWIIILVITSLSIGGFFAPQFIWLDRSEAYAQRGPDQKGLADLECPDGCKKWFITQDDYGYADWSWYTFPPGTPAHQLLSGEWAAAIKYRSIATWPQAMWLTHYFIHPFWVTNSNFGVIAPMAGTGTNRISSVIQNPQVQIRIVATMYCSKTAMGLACPTWPPNFMPSDSCFMVQDYIIRNISGAPLESLYFCQFLHGHPGDNSGPNTFGVYDDHFYSISDPEFPNSQNYHYDITLWADRIWFGRKYREYIGFGGIQQPIAYCNVT